MENKALWILRQRVNGKMETHISPDGPPSEAYVKYIPAANVEKLVEALKFYADKEEWRQNWFRVARAYELYDDKKIPEKFCGWEVAANALKEFNDAE